MDTWINFQACVELCFSGGNQTDAGNRPLNKYLPKKRFIQSHVSPFETLHVFLGAQEKKWAGKAQGWRRIEGAEWRASAGLTKEAVLMQAQRNYRRRELGWPCKGESKQDPQISTCPIS